MRHQHTSDDAAPEPNDACDRGVGDKKKDGDKPGRCSSSEAPLGLPPPVAPFPRGEVVESSRW